MVDPQLSHTELKYPDLSFCSREAEGRPTLQQSPTPPILYVQIIVGQLASVTHRATVLLYTGYSAWPDTARAHPHYCMLEGRINADIPMFYHIDK